MEMETHAEETERGWKDIHGFLGPFRPGTGPRRDPSASFPTGPEIGTALPDIVAADQQGRMIDVHAERNGRPAVVNFFRSAVWRPPCRTQLVELQSSYADFVEAGVDIYCLSYDEPDALADFASAHEITFPLLSDPMSEVITRFGILNTLIPEDDHPWHGIPFPGVYVMDADGIVIAKFFEHNLALRAGATQLLRAALGTADQAAVDAKPAVADTANSDAESCDPSSDEVTVDVILDATSMAPGTLQDLVVSFEVPQGQHVYGRPAPAGMVAAAITFDEHPNLIIGEVSAPDTQQHTMAGTGEVLAVYNGAFELRVPLAHNGSPAAKRPDGSRWLTITGSVQWQACDDETCGLPQHQPFSVEVRTDYILIPDIGKARPGVADMNGAAHFERMTSRRHST